MKHRRNEMKDLATFMEAWSNAGHLENSKPVEIYRTYFGNFNSTGELGNYTGPALSRHHPQFFESIEPGVRDLVRFITVELGWMTYTSCEGHSYGPSVIRSVERYVGILPRTSKEYSHISAILRSVARTVNWRNPTSTVRVSIKDAILRDEAAALPAIDLFLRRRRLSSWSAYFRSVDGAYQKLLAELQLKNTSEGIHPVGHQNPIRRPDCFGGRWH